ARMEDEIVVAGPANRYGRASLVCRGGIGDERAAVAVGCNIQRSVKIVKRQCYGRSSVFQGQDGVSAGRSLRLNRPSTSQIDAIRIGQVRRSSGKTADSDVLTVRRIAENELAIGRRAT